MNWIQSLLKAAMRDPDGFQIIGEELLPPVVDLVNDRLDKVHTIKTDTTTVCVWYRGSDEDFSLEDLSAVQGQFLGALDAAVDREHIKEVALAKVEAFTMDKAGGPVRGWHITIRGAT